MEKGDILLRLNRTSQHSKEKLGKTCERLISIQNDEMSSTNSPEAIALSASARLLRNGARRKVTSPARGKHSISISRFVPLPLAIFRQDPFDPTFLSLQGQLPCETRDKTPQPAYDAFAPGMCTLLWICSEMCVKQHEDVREQITSARLWMTLTVLSSEASSSTTIASCPAHQYTAQSKLQSPLLPTISLSPSRRKPKSWAAKDSTLHRHSMAGSM